MTQTIELKKRPCVLKAFKDIDTEIYYQYRLNGDRISYKEYLKWKKIAVYNEPYVFRYIGFTKNGNIVEVLEM